MTAQWVIKTLRVAIAVATTASGHPTPFQSSLSLDAPLCCMSSRLYKPRPRELMSVLDGDTCACVCVCVCVCGIMYIAVI